MKEALGFKVAFIPAVLSILGTNIQPTPLLNDIYRHPAAPETRDQRMSDTTGIEAKTHGCELYPTIWGVTVVRKEGHKPQELYPTVTGVTVLPSR